jgi:hypothetical protein
LSLYASGTDESLSRTPLGHFKLVDLNLAPNPQMEPAGFAINVEARASSFLPRLGGGEPPSTPLGIDWLTLAAEVRSAIAPYRLIGRVRINEPAKSSIDPQELRIATWLWEVQPEDIEQVEASRSQTDRLAPIGLNVEASGVARLQPLGVSLVASPILALRADKTFWQIESSLWERLLLQLRYTLGPTMERIAGLAAINHGSWSEAVERLEGARKHLRAGEDAAALRDCLSALEAIVKPPYSEDRWRQQLEGMPEQKAKALSKFFSGVGTFANLAGHHRTDDQRDESGDFPPVPLDHWEAELAVANTHFALAYALRLREAGNLTAT